MKSASGVERDFPLDRLDGSMFNRELKILTRTSRSFSSPLWGLWSVTFTVCILEGALRAERRGTRDSSHLLACVVSLCQGALPAHAYRDLMVWSSLHFYVLLVSSFSPKIRRKLLSFLLMYDILSFRTASMLPSAVICRAGS